MRWQWRTPAENYRRAYKTLRHLRWRAMIHFNFEPPRVQVGAMLHCGGATLKILLRFKAVPGTDHTGSHASWQWIRIEQLIRKAPGGADCYRGGKRNHPHSLHTLDRTSLQPHNRFRYKKFQPTKCMKGSPLHKQFTSNSREVEWRWMKGWMDGWVDGLSWCFSPPSSSRRILGHMAYLQKVTVTSFQNHTYSPFMITFLTNIHDAKPMWTDQQRYIT
jgi:hypothetical protein